MSSRIRLLFVCARNLWRSPTAERIYRNRSDLEVRSRGLRRSARQRLGDSDLRWADVVFAMESSHAKQIRRDHSASLGTTPVVVLDIPDEYRFMDSDLVKNIMHEVDHWLSQSPATKSQADAT